MCAASTRYTDTVLSYATSAHDSVAKLGKDYLPTKVSGFFSSSKDVLKVSTEMRNLAFCA